VLLDGAEISDDPIFDQTDTPPSSGRPGNSGSRRKTGEEIATARLRRVGMKVFERYCDALHGGNLGDGGGGEHRRRASSAAHIVRYARRRHENIWVGYLQYFSRKNTDHIYSSALRGDFEFCADGAN